jgi:2-oxoglutarate dehydrogenase E2 component (dihydrolipoamide succinyltransferase)
MIVEVKVPTPGESISEVELSNWLVADGDLVRKNQDLAEVESDKATLSITAPESGKIQISIEAGSTVKVNSIACKIDTSVEVPDDEEEDDESEKEGEETIPEVQKGTGKVESAQSVVQNHPMIKLTAQDSASPLKTTPLARSKMEQNNSLQRRCSKA